jgi:hypothetical protein
MGTRCQLLFVDQQRHVLQLDFVALEEVEVGGLALPPGTPLAVGLSVDLEMRGYDALLEALHTWADELATFDFDVLTNGVRPQFVLTRSDQQFVLDLV